jgi:hypothetical protein
MKNITFFVEPWPHDDDDDDDDDDDYEYDEEELVSLVALSEDEEDDVDEWMVSALDYTVPGKETSPFSAEDFTGLESALEFAHQSATYYEDDGYRVEVLVDGSEVNHQGTERAFVLRGIKEVEG